MAGVRLSFPVHHNEDDVETLEAIFTDLLNIFGKSMFAKSFASFISVEKLFIDLVHEKKH